MTNEKVCCGPPILSYQIKSEAVRMHCSMLSSARPGTCILLRGEVGSLNLVS